MVSRQTRRRRVLGKKTTPTLLQACSERFMAGGASGAAGGRAVGRTEGRSRARRLSSWRAICLPLAWSRGAHEAGRSVEHILPAFSLTHSPEAAPSRRRPAVVGRQAVSTASAGRLHGPRVGAERRGRPQRALAEPPPFAHHLQSARAKAEQRCFGAWLRRGGGPGGCRGAPSWERFVCVVAVVVVVRRLSNKRP